MRRVEVTYTQRPGAPCEAQSIALARIYARALQRYQENRKAAELAPEPDGRDDVKESNESKEFNSYWDFKGKK
jgi:hypothetical protein